MTLTLMKQNQTIGTPSLKSEVLELAYKMLKTEAFDITAWGRSYIECDWDNIGNMDSLILRAAFDVGDIDWDSLESFYETEDHLDFSEKGNQYVRDLLNIDKDTYDYVMNNDAIRALGEEPVASYLHADTAEMLLECAIKGVFPSYDVVVDFAETRRDDLLRLDEYGILER